MRTSYKEEDVCLLLKDITGIVAPQPTKERERLIQSGTHYCEMLPIEYTPSVLYLQTYRDALDKNAQATAAAIGVLADKIIAQKGRQTVLVSLARAGIPIGILLKRYIKWKYGWTVFHYSISIIRGRGIDRNAVDYILKHHPAGQVVFVDGWIGKGAILRELEREVGHYQDLAADLAVVADPAGITDLYGTRADLLIPSSCLNSTVSGLISRTFLRGDIIGKNDFHGAVYYGNLAGSDLSYEFISAIESRFCRQAQAPESIVLNHTGMEEALAVAGHYRIRDINLIKPGIGETTRVLLRRVPWKILLNEKHRNDDSLRHIRQLADEKGVAVEYYPLENYKACGIIKQMADI